jgi:hypothetical protein
MYSNICNDKTCDFNPKSNRCFNSKDKNGKISLDCICNIKSGRCITKKKPPNVDKGKKYIPINGMLLTSLTVKKCTLRGFGRTTLHHLKKCFVLPKSTYLKFGILKNSNEAVVFNENDDYFDIYVEEGDLIIVLPDYEILLKSNKNCTLKRV